MFVVDLSVRMDSWVGVCGRGGVSMDDHSVAETPGSCRMQTVKFRQVSQQARAPPHSHVLQLIVPELYLEQSDRITLEIQLQHSASVAFLTAASHIAKCLMHI